MKNVKVIVKDKYLLELAEDALKGDTIDLRDVMEIDTTIIEKMIEEKKDLEYKKRLDEFKKVIDLEHNQELNELKSKLDLQKETDAKETLEKLNNLKTKLNEEITSLKQTNDLLTKELDNKLKIKELEVENKYKEKITDLENTNKSNEESYKLKLENLSKEHTSEKEKLTLELQKEMEEKVNEKDKQIAFLQKEKASLNNKLLGESLEVWCNNTVLDYMQNGFSNCTWEKDNESIANPGDTKATKADFIFKVFADKTHKEAEELTSICLEMKEENPDSANKIQNKKYYPRLNENRIKKNCKYAVLVSNLESDSSLPPIFKVSGYDDMYVVRPPYLMTFLNIITSLTERFRTIVLADEQEKLNIKGKYEIMKEFDDLKTKYLDKPLNQLADKINNVMKFNQGIKDYTTKIEKECNTISNTYISDITNKLSRFEVQLDKNKILKNLEVETNE